MNATSHLLQLQFLNRINDIMNGITYTVQINENIGIQKINENSKQSLGTLTDLATLYYLVGFGKRYDTSAIQGRASSLSKIQAWRYILKSKGTYQYIGHNLPSSNCYRFDSSVKSNQELIPTRDLSRDDCIKEFIKRK